LEFLKPKFEIPLCIFKYQGFEREIGLKFCNWVGDEVKGRLFHFGMVGNLCPI